MLSFSINRKRNEVNGSFTRKYYGGKATQKIIKNNKRQMKKMKNKKCYHDRCEQLDYIEDEKIMGKLSNEMNSNIQFSHLSWFNHSYFHNGNLKNLLSMEESKFLNKYIMIKYFNDQDAIIKGRLTCTTHCGQFKLENIEYVGDRHIYNKHLRNDLKYTHWFHLNLVRNVYDYKTNTDITNMFIDLIKYKIVKYFLFILSYRIKDQESDLFKNNKAIKYLINHDRNILICNDYDILNCKYLEKETIKYVYGSKQNDFDYLRLLVYPGERKKDKLLSKQMQIHHFQLLHLICNFIDLHKQYFRTHKTYDIDEEKNKEKTNSVIKNKDNNRDKNSFIAWDKSEIKKIMSKSDERTV